MSVTGVGEVDVDPQAMAQIIALAEKHLKCREDGKALYQQSDAVFDDLLKLVAKTATTKITLTDGRQFEIVDNFAGKNVAFRPAGVHRFELKEVKDKLR